MITALNEKPSFKLSFRDSLSKTQWTLRRFGCTWLKRDCKKGSTQSRQMNGKRDQRRQKPTRGLHSSDIVRVWFRALQ